jgi:hypothetical protein
MIQKITEYLVRKKRVQDCLNFLLPSKNIIVHNLNSKVQEEDPLIVTHVSDVLLSVDKNKEAILLLAEKIREFPYLVPLLLKQA